MNNGLSKICRCLHFSGSVVSRRGTSKYVIPVGDNRSWNSDRLYSVKTGARGNFDRTVTSANTSEPEVGDWDLFVGLCLERKPLLSKALTPLEEKQKHFLMKHEIELSKKSVHEIRHETDKILLEKLKSGETEQANVTTAQDFEDACSKELAEFVPGSRKTEADSKNDLKSLERSLDSHLLLAVNQKLGDTYKWIVPHFRHTNEASLREVAEKGIATTFPSAKAKIVGNAPWGFYKYKYPVALRTGTADTKLGAKVFFYKAHLVAGQVGLPNAKLPSVIELQDYTWLTRAELPQYFTKEYFDKLSDFLIPEY